MLTQVAVHGLFDLKVKAEGDIEVDPHHTVEDVGRVFGQAFKNALGNRAGIYRMAARFCAMDDSLARVVLDFSGRPYSIINTCWKAPSVGNIPVSLFKHFLESFAYESGCNLHVNVEYGEDDHHMVEAIFKAFARALDDATQIDPRRAGVIPSSKGSL
jgi:imidazoleglycerol-phosphate dehydratase